MGSFINALIWRVHKQEKLSAKKDKASIKLASDYSVLRGRSMCPSCHHTLAPKDLVPVLSWLSLRGRCRYCKKPISWQYPFVELLTTLLFVVSYIVWPVMLNSTWQYLSFATWLIALVGLIALAVYDIKWMLLPDKIVWPLIYIILGSLAVQFALGRPINELLDAILACVVGGGFFWVIYQISAGKWIGGGDVKLGFLLGLLLATPLNAFIMLFLSSLLGMIWIAPLLLTKKITKTSKIPFGPFLIVATVMIVLFGQNIIDLYRSSLLI